MNSKAYLVAAVLLVGGVLGGYLLGTTSYESRIRAYEQQIKAKDLQIQQLQSKDALIEELQAKIQELQAPDLYVEQLQAQIQELYGNYTALQKMFIDSQQPTQIEVRIESVAWHGSGPGVAHNTYTITANNTGTEPAIIESISIRLDQAGSTPATFYPDPTIGIDVKKTISVILPYSWAINTLYVVRVTTTTGFYHEALAKSPPS